MADTSRADLHLEFFGDDLNVMCEIFGLTSYRTRFRIDGFRTRLANLVTNVAAVLMPGETAIWAELEHPIDIVDPNLVAELRRCLEITMRGGFELFFALKSADPKLETVLRNLDAMPDGSCLTVHTDAATLPWEILCTVWDDFDNTTNDPRRLWGYKYVIGHNLLPPEGEEWRGTPLSGGAAFVCFNLNPTIDEKFAGQSYQPIAEQRKFFAQQIARRGALLEEARLIHELLRDGSPDATVIYLYCHGALGQPFAGRSEVLDLGNYLIYPSSLEPPAVTGFAYTRSPLVFLNSCLGGLPALLSFASFKQMFMRKGAVGLIGTTIQMPATFAAAFGCRVLAAYLQGEAVGRAMHRLRRELVDKENPLGLFYSLQCPYGLTAPNGE